MKKISPSMTGRATIGALFFVVGVFLLVFAFFATGLRSATPSSGTLNPGGPTLNWAGTAAGGGSLDESTCVEGVSCDTFTLTLSGTPADWTGQRARIVISAADPDLTDYDVFVHKGMGNSGPLVGSAASGGTPPEVVELDPNDPAIGTGIFSVHVVYFAATAGDQYSGSVSVTGGGPTTPTPTPTPGEAFCEAPGKTVITDASGDAPSPAYDLQSVSLAEVPSMTGERQIVVTMKVADLSSVPPDTRWLTFFEGPGSTVFFAGMTTFPDENGGAPVFRFGTGTSAFDDKGFGAAGSNFNADGTITIVVPTDRLDESLVPGAALTNFRAGVRLSPGLGGVVYFNGTDLDSGPGVDDFTLAAVGVCGDGAPPPGGNRVQIGGPTFDVLVSPPGKADSAGEPTLAANPGTGSIFFVAGTEIDRVRVDNSVSPAIGTWEEVTGTLTGLTTFDPILDGDPDTTRIWVAQLVFPEGNSLWEFSDDDGETWNAGQGGGFRSGADHQSIGVGPYPSEGLGSLIPHPLYPKALYYCSQDIALVYCSRSDDGGRTFGPGVPVYTLLECGGLHGHPKVAPDGTVYLPNKNCGGVGMAVSEDAGMSWTVRTVAGTSPARWDPSVGIDAAGNVYLGYMEEGDDRPKIVVSNDKGQTWSEPVDVGAPFGLRNAVFPAVIAGDEGRAAYFFLGTTRPGDSGSGADMGLGTPDEAKWFAFVAVTYDGGAHWLVRNATPDDPVQRADICDAGIDCGAGDHRNLLDFNDANMDNEGRVLASLADGCTGPCVNGGPNSFAANGMILRQASGRRLLAQFDPVETVPLAPHLAGSRDESGVHLTWSRPFEGGAPIEFFNVYRGTEPGAETLYAQARSLTRFDDTDVEEGVEYFYKVTAVNSFGEGGFSNEVLPGAGGATETVCALPGVVLIEDATDDAQAPQFDIQTVRVAEPESLPGKIALILKVADLSVVPPGNRWLARFTTDGLITPGPFPGEEMDGWWVGMTTEDSAEPRFVLGTTGVVVDPAVGLVGARVFHILSDLQNGSGFTPDGTILLILDKEAVGATEPGDAFLNITPATRAVATPGNQGIWDEAGSATYVLRAANACAENLSPIAALSASPTEGMAPLTVTFDASGSSDPDGDEIVEYMFDPTDGSPRIAQSSPILSHTYATEGTFRPTVVVGDSRGGISGNPAMVQIEVGGASPTPTATPALTCIEDNDARIAYSGGWHLIDDANASEGHFRYHAGNSPNHFANLDFNVPAGSTGSITYSFAKSPKGGTADIFLDGVFKQTINYAGSLGTTKTPEFNPAFKVQFGNLSAGAHTLEIRNLSGVIYVDRFCLESASSSAQPATGPGNTTNQSGSAAAGQSSSSNYQMQSGSQQLSIVAESSLDVPFQLVLVNPSGVTLQTVNATNTMAVLNAPVTQSGLYVIKVTNLSLGPLQFSVTATPLVSR